MVRRRKGGNQNLKTPVIVELNDDPKPNGQDPWVTIENGEAVSAREVFYKKPVLEEPRLKHYERFKNKKQRICDGSGAKRIELHTGKPKGIKRRNRSEDDDVAVDSPAQKQSLKKAKIVDDDGNVNVFASVIKGNGAADSHKKRGKKRQFHKDSPDGAKENDENLDGLESGDSDEDEEYDEELDEDYSDEEVEGESDEQEEGLSDDEEVNENRVVPVKKPIHSRISRAPDEEKSSDECTDEEIDEDETHEIDDESESDGDGSSEEDSDEESEGEANLGEDREAIIMKYTDADAKLTLPDFDQFPFTDEDSSVTATRAFAWMIAPCDVQSFFKDCFQTNAYVAKRGTPNYYNNLFSTKRLVELVEKNHLEYDSNINIAEYTNGERLTLNGKGRVYPKHLTQHLSVGRSVQLVNPQTFDDRVWYMCEVLQEMFGCFVGANTYLTPRGSAGFAPHWDEIDAFLLQLEGKKYWKVYAPDSLDSELPREPSGNFTDDDMKGRKPTFEGWIEAGDLLYIPRGFIHQATTSEDIHSLHITISSGRLWTFADLFEKLVPEAVTAMSNNRWKLRKSLPVGMLDMNGTAEIDYRLQEHFDDEWRLVVDRHMTVLRNSLRNICDGGIDIMAKIFMRTALPPRLTEEEKLLSAVGHNEDILSGQDIEFRPSTKVKLIRRHAQRLLFESEDSCYISHRMANSRLYEGLPEQTFELPIQYVSGFNALSDSYPEWMSLSEMPEEMNAVEVQALCHMLYRHGLLMVQQLPDRIKRKVKRSKHE